MIPRSHIPLWPWRQKPPPPPAFELGLAASLTPGPRFGQFYSHTHQYKPQPSAGMPAFAYLGLGLVEYSFIGPGVANRNRLNPLEPPTMFTIAGLPTSGLGGLVAGQWITQPLIVAPDQLSEPLSENWVGG